MSDLRILVGPDGCDLTVENGDLGVDVGLETLVLTALMTDRRAAGEGVIDPGSDDPRGYWAESSDDPWGSRLWTLGRAKRTPEVLAAAATHARDALEWIVREGIASRYEVVTDWDDTQVAVVVSVTLWRGLDARWSSLWDGQSSDPTMAGVFSLRLLVR